MKTLHLSLWTILCLLASCGAVVTAADTPPPADAPLKADEAREIQGRWATHLGRDVVRENSIGMKMVLVPPGEFTQGTTAEGPGRHHRALFQGGLVVRRRGGHVGL